jgi:hypothetical protein
VNINIAVEPHGITRSAGDQAGEDAPRVGKLQWISADYAVLSMFFVLV